MNKGQACRDEAEKSVDAPRKSAFSHIIAVILNRNPKKQDKQAERALPVASKDQEAAIRAHLMPITLFVKVNKLLAGLVLVSVLFLMVTLFEHLSLYPLVETRYNYVEFVGSDHNFVNVIHTRHIDNEHLIQSLLRRYVVEREQIIKKPSRLVEKFSSPEVYNAYFGIIKKIAGRDLRSRVRRFIKILRYQKIESNIRQLEVEFTDMIKTQDGSSTRIEKSIWLINIKFEFIDTIRKYSEIAINPAGLIVTVYNIKRQS
ncbi:type IV secretion system protein [bacterium]|nr:type IV secretion system protein [bacterium]